MFDKSRKNNHKTNLWALPVTGMLLFAYAPFVIAQPIVMTDATSATYNSVNEPILLAEDEDPASTNGDLERHTTIQDKLIYAYAKEIGVNPLELQVQLESFARMTVHIESNNNRNATNAYSGAMSYYQFLPDSVVTAVNRLVIVMKQNDLGSSPYWARAVRNNPETIYSLSKEQQTLLVIADIIEQDRATDYLKRLGTGDNDAAKDIYYKFHHTAPDRATKTRTEQLFPIYFPETI